MAGACLLAGIGSARAGVFTLEPTIAASGEYSSNPQLRLDENRAGYAAVANLAATAQWDDGARHAELAPRVRVAAAGGDSAIGANGYYLATGADVKNDRSDFAARVNWSDDANSIQQPAAGTLIRNDVRSRDLDGSLSWSRLLTQRLQTSWSAATQDLGYDKAAAQYGLVGYRYSTAQGSLSEDVAERITLQLTAGAGGYEVPESHYTQSSDFVQGGVVARLTARWSATLSYGWSRVTSKTEGISQSGAVYAASLKHQGLRSTLSASVSQSIQPSGFGTLARAREGLVRTDWRVTERTDGYLALRAVSTTNSFESFALNDRAYRWVALGGAWRATEAWTATVELNWQSQSVTSGSQPVTGRGTGYGAVAALVRRFGRIKLS